MRNWSIQIALVSGVIILSVLLFYANRKPPVKNTETPGVNTLTSADKGLEHFLNDAILALDKNSRSKWEDIRKKSETLSGKEKKTWLDSATIFWDAMKRPDIASLYTGKIAEISNTEKDWSFAGQRFYYAVRFTKDPAERPALYNSAIACFQRSLQINPNNTDVKVDLASCYVEGSTEPMKGITMMREIEKTDSMNFKLQLNFGLFSANSGQWPRAISRFQKVLSIDSTYIEAYLHLADAYENNGETEKSIEALEQYLNRTDDMLSKTTIKEYILKKKKEFKLK